MLSNLHLSVTDAIFEILLPLFPIDSLALWLLRRQSIKFPNSTSRWHGLLLFFGGVGVEDGTCASGKFQCRFREKLREVLCFSSLEDLVSLPKGFCFSSLAPTSYHALNIWLEPRLHAERLKKDQRTVDRRLPSCTATASTDFPPSIPGLLPPTCWKKYPWKT